MRRGADLLVEALARAGTRYIFALSGNHVMSVFDAALEANISLVHVRHEAAAVHMADAWARATGEVGVALVTGGPGHANAVGALYTALASDSPVLLLSGHAPLNELGRGAFQEMAQAQLAAPITKASWTASSSDELGELVARAMRTARSGRPGPVSLSLPSDVLEDATSATVPNRQAFDPDDGSFGRDHARSIIATLHAAARPVIVVGPALTTIPARPLTAHLQQALGIPVITMESPRGIADVSLGVAAGMLARADAVLLVGKRRDFTLRFGAAFAADVVCIESPDDAGPVEVVRSLIAESPGAHPHASAAAWLREVEAALRFRPPAWREIAESTLQPMHALTVCAALQATLDAHPEAILVCDGGEFCQWVQGAVTASRRIINGPAGSIGAGLPFAVAAKLAYPESLVVAAMGDGTFGFHMSELDTAVRHRLPMIVLIGNDACWNAEHQIQLRTYGAARAHGCELLPSRYEEVARGLGGHGRFVSLASELPEALAEAIASHQPACINVAIARAAAPRL